MKLFHKESRAYRAWSAHYVREMQRGTTLSLPNAIQRHPNRHVKRYLPRLRLRVTPR